MSTEIKLTKDDEADSMDSTKYRGEIMPQLNQMDYKRTKGYLPRVHHSKATDEEDREFYRRLEGRLFYGGRFITPSFIIANSMLLTFQVVGEIMPQLNQMDYKRTKAYLPRVHHSKETDEEDREFYHRLEGRLFYRGRFITPSFIVANNMLLTFQVESYQGKRKESSFSFGLLLFIFIVRWNEVPSFLEFYEELSGNEDLTDAQIEKRGMFKCLNRYFRTITKYLKNKPKAFGLVVCVFSTNLEVVGSSLAGGICGIYCEIDDPPYGRSVGYQASSSKTSSPNFKRKTARMSVRRSNFVNLDSSSEEHQNEKTPSPPPRNKSLSPPQALSKSISSKSTHYTSSSSS
nr:hypothetical protein [Tanacetum cinerariifolium]